MPAGSLLSRVFSADTLTCPHCRSAGLYPNAGFFGELPGLLGRMRHACGACRLHAWLRPGAEFPQAPPDGPELEVPRPSGFSASLEALDLDAAPLPPPRTDLSALDEELARGRRRRKKH